jgi:hypothetical protein
MDRKTDTVKIRNGHSKQRRMYETSVDIKKYKNHRGSNNMNQQFMPTK